MPEEFPGSPLTTRRTALIGGLLLTASAAGAGIKLREREETPLKGSIGGGIPRRLDQWTAIDTQALVRPEDEETPSEESRYDQEVSRIYEAPGVAPVMLLIAYGSTQSDTLQLHRPEFCYPASGFDIGEREVERVAMRGGGGVPSAFFTAVRGERTEQILYWTRLGDQFPTSWVGQHLARVKNSYRGIVPNGVLVRASVIDPDRSTAREQLKAFLSQLVERSSPLARRALIG